MMIPPGECTYAGRKRRKPVQKQRPATGAEKSNPSKRHRDRLNAELDHLASLLPLPPDIVSKLDKLSVLRLSVSYLRVKSFFQAVPKGPWQPGVSAPSPEDRGLSARSAVLEGRLLLESLDGFALVVSAEGMIFYASATIVDYLGFHQTDVMHQNIYDYIHVDDRQDFCRQLHWAMDPPHVVFGQPLHSETEDAVLGRLLRAQEGGAGAPTDFSAFLTRCFVCRVRCLLDSTSGFLTMQFQGKLKFLFGQKRKAPSGTVLPPRLSLFCIVVPVLLPSVAEMKMKSAFLRVKHRMDVSASMDAKARAAASPCEPEFHGKPSYFAGRNNGENIPVLRTQADAGRWARVPARAPCLCLRNSPDLVSDPEGAAGDRSGDEHGRVPSGSSGARGRREIHAYSCCFEAPGPVKHLSWMTGKHGQDGGTKLKLESSKSDPFSMCAVSLGSCVPCPGVQGAVHTSGVTAFRNSPSCHPGSHSPSAYTSRTSRTSRALRDSDQGQVHPPPSCPFPQGSLDNGLPQPRGQRLTAVGHSIEDTKFRGGPTPSGAPCNPILSLDVPIKMESDSGSEDAADGYSMSPSQVWLGASGMAKRQLVTFPTRMHLKTEPEARHHLYAPHLGHSLLEAHPSGRAPLRPGRELAPFHPAHCACLERVHGLPEPDRPHHFCAQGHQPPALGCDCRAPGTTPIVKREPLDSPLWASHSQGAVPGMFPKSAVATLMPPKAPECAFLP
ncbi:aryl hydrocarbon receptor repressor isoform X1 [Callorhinus ursinus]|uniref:Aryl hydrocarbon receptor repressor n=1 Tax=Callorhinus ursinus TaxID=34884 RepID=A0A3Q7NPW5_CALUR|nr:aryl hydrocarbon receptor repressor isoform X1 [Callorhinus ursinus]XP_025723300.1 aryl hydrocarbon receptor repressor isoform X1 [Callorhinus ursinus]